MKSAGDPALAVRGLGFVYEDGRRALEGIEFELHRGESLGVIGPNGAGKTTLFLNLAGVYTRSEGEIAIFGQSLRPDLQPAALVEIRRRLGVVFHETDDQLFSPTVFDDVAFGALNFGLPRESVQDRVESALRAVGLDGYGGRTPHHLSAGEKRRAALAAVLSYDPDILILDEPTSDLDPRGRRELVTLLRTMPQAKLLASHDMEFVLRTCDRLLLVDAGQQCALDTVERVLANRELLESHGLEVPLGLAGLDADGLRSVRDGDAHRET